MRATRIRDPCICGEQALLIAKAVYEGRGNGCRVGFLSERAAHDKESLRGKKVQDIQMKSVSVHRKQGPH